VTGLTVVSGNNQSAQTGSAFGAPLVVQLNVSGGSAAGIPVTFSITGPGTLSSTSATTNASGQAQVNVTAGATAGTIQVTASAAGATPQTFSLTVNPAGPSLQSAVFMNAADFQRNALSPCSLATVFSTGLTPGLQGMVSGSLFGPLPFVLANDRLTVGGGAAPLVSAGRNANNQEQLTFQVPCEVTPGSSVPIAITVGSTPATSINVPIQAASPGIFQTQMSDGVSRAIAVRPDGSFVSLQNPGRKGENLVVFVTGLGQTNPPQLTNSVAPPFGASIGAPTGSAPVAPAGTVVVGMAGGGAPLVSAVLSDELVGVWLVTFTVPTGVAAGNNVSFSLSVIPAGSSSPISSGTTSLPIQ
jgi:uncharacterized protein (TIGR03437 family)